VFFGLVRLLFLLQAYDTDGAKDITFVFVVSCDVLILFVVAQNVSGHQKN